MQKVHIRSACHEDMDAICQLSNEINLQHSIAMPEDFVKPDGSNKDAPYWSDFIDNECSTAFVAELNGKIIGIVGAIIPTQPRPSFLTDKRRCMLSTIVITKKHQQQGIGKMLVTAVEEYAAKNNASEVVLEVMAFNKSALEFYAAMGYGDFSQRLVKAV